MVESDSAEYSAEDELSDSESETDEQPEPEFSDAEVPKDAEDVDNSFKRCCA